MPRKSPPIKYRVVIDKSIQFTDDDLCRLLLGMGIETFVQAVKVNRSGEYDDLFKKETVQT